MCSYDYPCFNPILSLNVTLPGVTLLFNEPPDARKPNVRWRLYVFKGGEVLKGIQFSMYILNLLMFLLPVKL